MAKLKLTITTPSAIFYDDLVDIVTLRVNLGYKGFLPNASEFFSNIEPGTLTINYENSSDIIKCHIGSGLIYSNKEAVNIITDDIVKIEDINLNALNKQKEMLENRLKENLTESLLKQVEEKLENINSRIKAYNEFKK